MCSELMERHMTTETSGGTSEQGDTLLIRGKEIPVTNQQLEQSRLRFFVDNPRVYSIVHGNGRVPGQEEIQERLLQMEHVKALVYDIDLNGGLIEPLIVRDATLDRKSTRLNSSHLG